MMEGMGTLYKALHDIAPHGQHIRVEDAAVWEKLMAEFRMDCRITVPLRADLFLLPTEGGCLIRGKLTGTVVQPCDRCAEDAPERIDHNIEVFATLSDNALTDDETQDPVQDDIHEHVFIENGIPMLDISGLCWEEFMLALPLRPLCSLACKGLCAQCGANFNLQTCACQKNEGDPRLAALRALKIQKAD